MLTRFQRGLSPDGSEEILNEDMRKIEQIRAKFDDVIMAIDGIESISIGLDKQGKACLMLGASVPVEQVRAKLPNEIFKIPVQIIYIGQISAQ